SKDYRKRYSSSLRDTLSGQWTQGGAPSRERLAASSARIQSGAVCIRPSRTTTDSPRAQWRHVRRREQDRQYQNFPWNHQCRQAGADGSLRHRPEVALRRQFLSTWTRPAVGVRGEYALGRALSLPERRFESTRQRAAYYRLAGRRLSLDAGYSVLSRWQEDVCLYRF